MNGRGNLLAALVFAVLVVAAAFTASAEVHFSTFKFSADGGGTWQDECPILAGTNRTFVLKAEWNGRDERKMVWGGLLHCKISSERDFASSEGKEWGSPLFWQNHDEKGVVHKRQYLTGTPRPFLFHVDVSGFSPGTWHFACHVGYYLEKPDPDSPNKNKKLVEAVRNFFVYIDDPENPIKGN